MTLTLGYYRLVTFGFWILLATVPGSDLYGMDQKPAPRGTCPVMPGEPVKAKFFVDYQGKRIHLCCRNCVKAFQRDPERYNAVPVPETIGTESKSIT